MPATRKKRKPVPRELAVIDAETGTVLGPGNLHAVLVSKRELDEAEKCDSNAHALAMHKGAQVTPELLRAICLRRATKWRRTPAEAVRLIAEYFDFDVEADLDGRLILYTGTKG